MSDLTGETPHVEEANRAAVGYLKNICLGAVGLGTTAYVGGQELLSVYEWDPAALAIKTPVLAFAAVATARFIKASEENWRDYKKAMGIHSKVEPIYPDHTPH